MKSILARRSWLLIVCVVLILINLLRASSPHPVLAVEWVDAPYSDELDEAATGAVNKGSFDYRSVGGIMVGLQCPAFPILGICTNDPEKLHGMYQRSVVGAVSNATAMMYLNKPADFITGMADVGSSLGLLPKPVYAQGVGFSGLGHLLPIWKAFRNIAYLLLAIMLVAVGFMVMLRKKIDPRTVVTVQNALPKIVITLLLITFSYAIVGLMVDVMYLIIFVVVSIFESTGLLPPPSPIVQAVGFNNNQSLYSQAGLITAFNNIFSTPVAGNFGGITTPLNLAYHMIGIDPGIGKAFWIGGSILGIIGALIPATSIPSLGLLAASNIPPLLGLLLALALLLLVIKLFVFFLSSYIQILLALIFAPLQIVFEAMPGSTAFSDWIRNLVANLAVFPIGAGMFMISAIFANLSNQAGAAPLWVPPYTPLVSASLQAVSAMVAIGVLFTIPTIAGQIKEMLKTKPFISAGPETIGGSLTEAGGVGWQTFQFWYSHHQHEELKKAMGGGKSGH